MGAAMVLDKEIVTKLPSLSRDFTEFAALSPHVKVDDERISVAGQNDRFNAIQIDGALSQDVFGLASSLPGGDANAKPIPLDAIEQYQVLVAPFDVRQSGFTGGVLNAVTRSGTNRWTGSGIGFYRDENFLGDLTVDDVSQKPETLENYVFGLTFGGPLLTDRVHLFAAAEVERRRWPTIGFNLGTDDPVRVSLSPDSAQRDVDIHRDAYGLEAGDYTVVTLPNDLANVFARLDVQLDPSNRFVLRHNFVSAQNEPGPNRAPFDAYEFSSYATTVDHTSNSTVFQLLSRLSPRFSNEFLVNFQVISDRVDPLATYPRVEVDITSDLGGQELTRLVRTGAELNAHANELDQDIIQVTNNLTAAVGLADLEANLPARYDIVAPFEDVTDPAVRFSVLQLAGYVQREETAFDERLSLRYGIRVDFPLILDQPRANPDAAARRRRHVHRPAALRLAVERLRQHRSRERLAHLPGRQRAGAGPGHGAADPVPGRIRPRDGHPDDQRLRSADRARGPEHRRAGGGPPARGRLQQRLRLRAATPLRHADVGGLRAQPCVGRVRAGDPGEERRQRLLVDAEPAAAARLLEPCSDLRRLLVQQVRRRAQPRLERRHVELRPQPGVHRPQRSAGAPRNVRPAAQDRGLGLDQPVREHGRHRGHPHLHRTVGPRLLVRLSR
jgi:hypothetical protein